MSDAFLYNQKLSQENSHIISQLGLEKEDFILMTIHRPHNTIEEVFRMILKGLNNIKEKIIFPCHPRTKKLIDDHHIKLNKNIILIEPVHYFDMIALETAAKAMITDSGGAQKRRFLPILHVLL